MLTNQELQAAIDTMAEFYRFVSKDNLDPEFTQSVKECLTSLMEQQTISASMYVRVKTEEEHGMPVESNDLFPITLQYKYTHA